MQNKSLNCAVVGLGIGEQHVKALLTHPAVDLTAICDLNESKIDEMILKYQLNTKIGKCFSEILKDDHINMVSIATFDDVHFEQVMACLQRGKHVFVEKPLCQSEAQLNEIYQLLIRTGLGLSSNLILRKAPLYLWMQDEIRSGKFGEIYNIETEYLYGRIHKITDGWRSAVENYSVMAGGGIHLIDLMIRFFGQNPVRVQSYTNKIVTKNTNFRYDDFHAATFEFNQGAIGRVSANFGCVHKHQHVLRVFGTKGTFIYDDMGARVHWHREEDSQAEIISLAPKPLDKGFLLLDFINNILNNNYRDKIKAEFDVMSAVIAADYSVAHNNHPININYLI